MDNDTVRRLSKLPVPERSYSLLEQWKNKNSEPKTPLPATLPWITAIHLSILFWIILPVISIVAQRLHFW